MSSRKKVTPFDRLLKQQCQKGVAASKSTGFVGKWGTASFTSVRTSSVNGSGANVTKAPKKFFKSRQQDPPPQPEVSDMFTPMPTVPAKPAVPKQVLPLVQSVLPVNPEQQAPATKKFFASRKRQRSDPEPEETEPPRAASPPLKVPPLKLRLKTAAATQPSPEKQAEPSDDATHDQAIDNGEPCPDKSWLSQDVDDYRNDLEKELTPSPLPSPPREPTPEPPPPERPAKVVSTPASDLNRSVCSTYSRRAYGRKARETPVTEVVKAPEPVEIPVEKPVEKPLTPEPVIKAEETKLERADTEPAIVGNSETNESHSQPFESSKKFFT